jgi:TPR repeat protein
MKGLLSIPEDHLLQVLCRWMYHDTSYNSIGTADLNGAAAVATNKENIWLLDKLRSKGDVPKFGVDWKAKCKWVVEIMASGESSHRSQYYLGRALFELDDYDASLKLIQLSAEAGFAPAISWFGTFIKDEKEEVTWLRKAADLKDPDGMYWLTHHVEKGQHFNLLCDAASRGHMGAMRDLANKFSDRLSLVERAAWGARYLLYHGDRDYIIPGVAAATQRMFDKKNDAEDLAVLCAVGRELRFYSLLWDGCKHLDVMYQNCIYFHITALRKTQT